MKIQENPKNGQFSINLPSLLIQKMKLKKGMNVLVSQFGMESNKILIEVIEEGKS